MSDLLHRYLCANGWARKRFRRKHYPLRQKLWQRFYQQLQGPPRRTRSAPPGAYRTAWGWRRVARKS